MCMIPSASKYHVRSCLGTQNPLQDHLQKGAVTVSIENIPSLRIMGSQKWVFGDPRTLLYTSKPLYRRVQ